MALPGSETVRAKTPYAENLYAKVRHAIPAIEWPVHAQDIDAIMTLKRTRNAVVLAHNYQTPEIFHCVADFVGDSLALAREAMTADADVIVLAGVHFMAETAKLLNPEKTVLIPDTWRWLFACRIDPAGGCAAVAANLSGGSDRHLCEHVGRRESLVGYLLHVRQCARGDRIAGRRSCHHAARRVSGPQRRGRDKCQGHRLVGPLRGA